MNRRNFFKTVTGFIAGVCVWPKEKIDILLFPTEAVARDFSDKKIRPKLTNARCDDTVGVWKFYINGKEVDSSRVVDRNGALRWPFKGAKKGDL